MLVAWAGLIGGWLPGKWRIGRSQEEESDDNEDGGDTVFGTCDDSAGALANPSFAIQLRNGELLALI